MRKRNMDEAPSKAGTGDAVWLDLERLAQAELTSEDPAHPIEAALTPGIAGGWQASEPGAQTLRLVFDAPLGISRIRLVFCETLRERTQEFVLRWLPDGEVSYREIVRQQYHFSPPDTTEEREDYRADLAGVRALELRIVPEIGGGPARASLEELRVVG